MSQTCSNTQCLGRQNARTSMQFDVESYFEITVSNIEVLTNEEYKALEAPDQDVEYFCIEPRSSTDPGFFVSKIYQGSTLIYEWERGESQLLAVDPDEVPDIQTDNPDISMITGNITVDIVLDGKLQVPVHVPVNLPETFFLTEEQYNALERTDHGTEYFIIETLSNNKKVVRKIYQGKEAIYDLTAADNAFYKSDYVTLLPSDAETDENCIMTADGKVFQVFEY